jgi:murein DD-endopeptidase MepM/ murein hydrolase activator NlpD
LVCVGLLFIGSLFLNIHYIYIQNNSQNNKLHRLEAKINLFINHLIDNQIINEALLKDFDIFESNKNYNNLAPISMPVEGFVSKGIDNQKKHNGIDIACSLNAKIKSAQKGIVVFSDEIKSLGKTIIIAHPNQYFSLYAHLNTSIVSSKTYVEQDQIIGYAGQSGNTDGPHLHFEIWKNDTIIDPRNLIKEYRIKDVSIR